MKTDSSMTTRIRNELITFAKMNHKVDYLSVIGKQQYTVFGNQECTENGNMNTPVWCK